MLEDSEYSFKLILNVVNQTLDHFHARLPSNKRFRVLIRWLPIPNISWFHEARSSG